MIEIERKFLVKSNDWRKQVINSKDFVQGYLAQDNVTVRVRAAGEKGFLTIKSKSYDDGLWCKEYEYEIPLNEAKDLLEMSTSKVSKTRHNIKIGDLIWEIDEFSGANTGLIVAEVELECFNQGVWLPDWIGDEVTGNFKYTNLMLSKNPFQSL